MAGRRYQEWRGGGIKEQMGYGGEEASGVDGGGGLKSRWGMAGRRYQEGMGGVLKSR